MNDDLFERLQAASYTEDELTKLINFIWALDEKHPTLWTIICKRLIITMMKDRMESSSLHLKMAQALYSAQTKWTK